MKNRFGLLLILLIGLTAKTAELSALSMQEFNQLYFTLGSGPMPNGEYKGTILQKPPFFNAIKNRIVQQFNGSSILMELAKPACRSEAEDCIFEFIWRGKIFYPANSLGQVEVRSQLNLPIIGSLSIFPMNTYCGISQIDTRRESIITDGGFSDDFASYVPLRDSIINRKNLNITEEFRLLHPGVYIGKVYSNKVLLFNLLLEKVGGTNLKDTANACFDGTKTR